MALNHLQIFYGAYLDDISNEIPQSDIMLSGTDDIEKSMEPGKPGMPSADTWSFQLSNRDPQGNKKYPFSWFKNASRDNGTYEIEIFFEVRVNGDTRFVGLYDSTDYGEREQHVTVSIRDLTKIFKEDKRSFLKTFSWDELQLEKKDLSELATSPSGMNDIPDGADLHDTRIKHECLRFIAERASWLDPRNPVHDENINAEFTGAYADHIGVSGGPENWDKVGYEDLRGSGITIWDINVPAKHRVRNTFVQIGEITVFTRIRESIVVHYSQVGSFVSEAYLLVDVWHWNYDTVQTANGTVYPRGKFFPNNDDKEESWSAAGSETGTGSRVNLKIHDYNLGYDQIAITENDLPSKQPFIGGAAYSRKGNFIRIITPEYSFFDVVEKTVDIFNSEVTRNFTQDSFGGSIEVLDSAPGDSDGKATFEITINGPPQIAEQVRFVVEKTGESSEALVYSTDSAQDVADSIFSAIQGSSIEDEWDVTQNGTTISGEALEVGKKYNGRDYYIKPRKPTLNPSDFGDSYEDIIEFKDRGLSAYTTINYDDKAPTSGGQTAPQSGLRIFFGFSENADSVDTAQLTGGESPSSIAQKIADAINNDATISADFTAVRSGNVVEIDADSQESKHLSVSVLQTGMEESDFTVQHVSGNYELFDTSKLLDAFKRAFYADPVFFGWIERDFINILVGLAWQTVSYLYSTSTGKLALHSRDYYESFPTSFDPDDYPATQLKDEDIEPIGGPDRENGFQTYSVEYPADILEINNVKADENSTIYVDESGVRDSPSYRNEDLQTDNYRINDLGVPDTDESSAIPVLRLSPRSDSWPHNQGLQKFIPTPAIQAIIYARNFDYPMLRLRYQTSLLKYPDLDVGDYVVLSDRTLWLITYVSISPKSLTLDLDIEFKKDLYKAFESFKEPVVVQEKFEVFKEGEKSFKEAVYVDEHYRQRQTVKAFKEPVYVAEKTDKQLTQSGPLESVYANESFQHAKNPPENALSMNFDGTDDSVDCPDSASLDITGPITVEAWVKPNAFNGGFEVVVAKGLTASGTPADSAVSPYVLRFTGSGEIVVELWQDTDTKFVLSSNSAVPIGEWTHVCFAWDGTTNADNLKIYINGELDISSSQTTVSSLRTNNRDLTHGYDNFRNDDRFAWDGLLDEIRIWNEKRTQSEIKNSMNSILDPANHANLIGYWRFEDDSDISTALDETSNNNDGTLNGPLYEQDTPFDYDLS